MKTLWRSLFFILGSTLILTWTGHAQPVRPVFTSTSLDGQLIGLETGDLTLGVWKPNLALAYGLTSKSFRYRVGIGVTSESELPLSVTRLSIGQYRAAYVNWPGTPILGREGQTGLELGLNMGTTRYTGFIGDLWPAGSGDVCTPVAYFAGDSSYSYELPYGWRFGLSSQSVMGLVFSPGDGGLAATFEKLLDTVATEQFKERFSSNSYSASLSLGGLRLSGRFGMLENQAELERFEFVTGVRGISQSLRGHRYWNATIERQFAMYQTSIPLSLPEQLATFPFVPQEIPVKLDGRVFFQGGAATHKAEPDGNSRTGDSPAQLQAGTDENDFEFETDMLFSWGFSTTLSIHEFDIRAEFIFTQSGETRFNFSF